MKSIKIMTIALVAAFGMTACNDHFLDKNPDERTLIDTEKKVVQLLTSAYPTGSYMWLGELLSDNIIDNHVPHLPSSSSVKQITTKYNYSSYARWDDQMFRFEPATMATYNDWDSPGTLWSGYYNSIATVNHALQAIDELVAKKNGEMSEVLKAAKAEALLIRSYCHFMLAQFFSPAYMDAEKSAQPDQIGIPYVTEIEDVVKKDYKRGTVAETYAKIQQDLEEALPYISDRNFEKPKWHFNVNAAHAYAARFYLTTRQYAKVIEHANAVLGSDAASSAQWTMDYSLFTSSLSTFSDYAKVWQSPDLRNNLMLLATYSIHSRRVFGYRYSCAGPAARAAFMIHSSPLWGGYILPAFGVAGFTAASSSSQDYGFTTTKIGEEFEYSDKIAGIGYPHQILTPFTANILLLERAEAKAMTGDYTGAGEDLMAYWNNQINSFNEDQKKSYVDTRYLRFMEPEHFQSIYGKINAQNSNVIMDWSFTQQYISPSFVVAPEAIPYMNCVNDFRRYETVLQGMRFFDLKRWGMDITHEYAEGREVRSITLKGDDPRRAVEVPWESMSAGMESSRPTVDAPKQEILKNDNALRAK